jgi:hypothetical protein
VLVIAGCPIHTECTRFSVLGFTPVFKRIILTSNNIQPSFFVCACFILVSFLAYSSTLTMEAICSSETSVYFHLTAQRYVKEDRNFNNKLVCQALWWKLIHYTVIVLGDWITVSYCWGSSLLPESSVVAEFVSIHLHSF